MKYNSRILTMLAFAVFLPLVMVFAQTPRIINFQGKLNDKDGKALTGNFNIVFSIYNTALAGEAQWQEPRSQVPVQSGIINILLGSVVPFPEALFAGSGQLYLGIKVADDPELTPRFQITSVPYAIQANLPAGIIVMWSGAIDNIPAGWALCDGKSYPRADASGNITTPDLCDRFIVGAGRTYEVYSIGGSLSVALTTAQIPSHKHSITDKSHKHPYYDVYFSESINRKPSGVSSVPLPSGSFNGSAGSDNDNVGWLRKDSFTSNTSTGLTSTNASGGDKSHENRPPYYALAFIMKL